MVAEVDSSRNRVWFITGVSTGFGRAIAEVALSRGCRVMGSVRREEHVVSFEKLAPGRARAVSFDIAYAATIAPAVETAIAAFGQIDVLVNNAGYALLGALEEISDDQFRQQMETNFFGAVSIRRALLSHMRLRRTGHIVYITSVGGFVGGPGWSAYCASKFALEGLVDGGRGDLQCHFIFASATSPRPWRRCLAGRPVKAGLHEERTRGLGGGIHGNVLPIADSSSGHDIRSIPGISGASR